MEINNNSGIPNILIGKWGHYSGDYSNTYITINKDGSGNLVTLNDVKWSVKENILIFHRINSYDPPMSGSANYSIIDGRLLLSGPFEGDMLNQIKDILIQKPNGLDKIKDRFPNK